MNQQIKNLYLLRCITNLHAGSGEANFGVIDNLIQRDPATGLPCIHSSGLKGAIKQTLDDAIPMSKEEASAWMFRVFGSDTNANKSAKSVSGGNGKTKRPDPQQGEYVFLSAQLLALPVQCERTPFVLVTCPEALNEFCRITEDLGCSYEAQGSLKDFANFNSMRGECAPALDPVLDDARIGGGNLKLSKMENFDPTKAKALEDFFGRKNVAVVSDEAFVELCDNLHLPVIARNALDDGESKNLWYEQVLPRESLLYFFICQPEEPDKQDYLNDMLGSQPVQVGGNASVGYGITRIRKIA